MSPELLNNPLVVIQLIVLGALGLLTGSAFVGFVREKTPIAFEGAWGGFGGGLGGWCISRTLALLMATVVFGCLFALVGGYMFAALVGKEKEKKKDDDPSHDKVVVCSSYNNTVVPGCAPQSNTASTIVNGAPSSSNGSPPPQSAAMTPRASASPAAVRGLPSAPKGPPPSGAPCAPCAADGAKKFN